MRDRRDLAIGLETERLVVRDGRSFDKVRIVSVDDGGVSIRHEQGAARLRYADLTPEQQAKFGMDAALAAAAEKRERQEIAAYDQWHEAETAKSGQTERRGAALAARRRTSAAADRGPASAPDDSRRTGALSQPARTFGSGSIYGSSRYRSSRPTYRNAYYYQSYTPRSGYPRVNTLKDLPSYTPNRGSVITR